MFNLKLDRSGSRVFAQSFPRQNGKNIVRQIGGEKYHLYSALRPFTCLGAVLGLFPLSKFYTKSGPNDFRYCSALFFYGCSLTLFFLVSVFLALFYVIMPTFSNLQEFGNMLRFLFTVLSSVTSFVCSVIHIFNHSRLGKLYQKFKELDEVLPSKEDKVFKGLKYSGWGFILYFLLSEALYIVFEYDKYDSKSSTASYRVFMLYNIILTVAIPTFILLHGAGLCLCTAMYYSNLNEKIKSILDFPSVNKVDERDETFEKRQIFKEENRIIDELENYRGLHLKIWSFTQTTSNYLSSVLFVVMTSEFVIICYNIYGGMIALYNNERENQFIVMNFGTAFTLLMGVGILAWAVDVQTKEHEKTSEIINWCSIPRSKTNDVPLFLLRFSIQILQSKPVLSVMGFFSVNRGFSLSMFGTLSTYVVILLQFRTSDDGNNCCEIIKNFTNISTLFGDQP